MEITDELIDKLFENKHFQEKLNDYVAENLRISQNYDAWEGNMTSQAFHLQENQLKSKVKAMVSDEAGS